MFNYSRRAATTLEVLCVIGVSILIGTVSASAQAVRSSEELAIRASEAAAVVELVIDDAAVNSRPALRADSEMRRLKLERASSLLLSVAARASRGATASDTRADLTAVARLLDSAYSAAKEAGEYPDADLVETIASLMRDLDSFYDPKPSRERR